MIIDANSIREGNILEYEDKLWQVLSREHVKPGKGGAFVQVELKDIINGTKLNKRFRSDENVEKARIDEIEYKYLYQQGDILNLMNLENSEIEEFDAKLLGEDKIFLHDDVELNLKVGSYEGNPIWIRLPDHIICEVIDAEPVIKGQTATASYKPATIYNDIRIKVPPFIEIGEKMIIRSEDKSYVGRAK